MGSTKSKFFPTNPFPYSLNFGTPNIDELIEDLKNRLISARSKVKRTTLTDSAKLIKFTTDYLYPLLKKRTQSETLQKEMMEQMKNFIKRIIKLPHSNKKNEPFFKDKRTYFSMFGFTESFITAILQLFVAYRFQFNDKCRMYVIFLHKFWFSFRSSITFRENVANIQKDKLFIKYKEYFITYLHISIMEHTCKPEDIDMYVRSQKEENKENEQPNKKIKI